VTRFVVDVCHYTHTCPAEDGPHVVETRRTVVEYTPGAPCERPVTIRSGERTVVIGCGEVRPADKQCPACRTTIEVRHETTVHIGPYVKPSCPVPAGFAPDPCHVCDEPLAAALASWRVHVLCHRYGRHGPWRSRL
jgi:hypothetical protein